MSRWRDPSAQLASENLPVWPPSVPATAKPRRTPSAIWAKAWNDPAKPPLPTPRNRPFQFFSGIQTSTLDSGLYAAERGHVRFGGSVLRGREAACRNDACRQDRGLVHRKREIRAGDGIVAAPACCKGTGQHGKRAQRNPPRRAIL